VTWRRCGVGVQRVDGQPILIIIPIIIAAIGVVIAANLYPP
jgi:uncharacterized paraquat-inducible protein A